MQRRPGLGMRTAGLLGTVVWTAVFASIALAEVVPHPDWVNSLKPAGVPGKELTLARDGATEYVILLPDAATGQDQKAAAELAKWLGLMTGATYPIIREGGDAPTGPVISIGKTARLAAADLPQREADLGADGIAISVKGTDLFLWGGYIRGAINAVFVLLEEDLGCRWYSAEHAPVIPHRPTLVLRPVARVHIPPLELREPFYSAATNVDWSLQNRTSSRSLAVRAEWGGYLKSVPGMVHTSSHYVSSAKFKTNPEYFAMNAQGKRTPTQLCLTNPDVIRISIERALGFLEEHPDARFLDFSAADRKGYCLCPPCKALDENEATDHGYARRGYGSHAGTTIALVNALADAIAEKHPNVLVTTLAYLGTLEPTKQLRPRDNVRIVMATSAHWGTIFRFVTESAVQADIMRGWKRVGAKLIIWHYPIVYGPTYLGPTLNLHVISGDMRFFMNNGAKGIMLQGRDTYSRGVDRELLRCWLAAKQMWHPRLNTSELVRDFTYGFYGPAAIPVQKLQDLMHKTWDDNHMGPDLQYGSIGEAVYKAPFINTAMAYLDEAERIAGDDLDLRTRVRLAKVPIWYAQARRGPVDGLPAYNAVLDSIMSFAKKEYGLQVMDWASMSNCVSDVNHWRAVAALSPNPSVDGNGARTDIDFVCLGPTWEVRHDPTGQGVQQRWFESSNAPAPWGTMRDDQIEGVNPQGLNELKGDVWFRAECAVPDGFDSRTYFWMLLDAFDREDMWVYLDGKLVFKQVAADFKKPVLSGVRQWPVMLAARKLLLPGTSYKLVIRVRYRDRADASRFKPVSLISSHLAPMTNGRFPKEYPGFVREIPRLWVTAVEEHRRLRSKR